MLGIVFETQILNVDGLLILFIILIFKSPSWPSDPHIFQGKNLFQLFRSIFTNLTGTQFLFRVNEHN